MTTATMQKSEFKCGYCSKSFAREKTLAVHLCEPKRRAQQKNETGVQIGFAAYIRFYELSQPGTKTKTYDEFAASSYYKAFVKFGRYCQDIRAINVPRFIDWILKNNKKLDYWCKDSVYEEYLAEYLRAESHLDALARGLEESIKWEETTGNQARDFLRYGNENVLCYAIRSGRVSSWLLYNSDSGVELLGRLQPEQVSIIWDTIDPDFWTKKFADYKDDAEYVREILTKAGW